MNHPKVIVSYHVVELIRIQRAKPPPWAAVRSKAVVVYSLFIVAQFGLLFSVLSSFTVVLLRKTESWLLFFNCVLLTAMWLLEFCVSSSWCHGLVCDCGI